MGLDVVESEKHFRAGTSPRIVNPSLHGRNKIDEKAIKGELKSRFYKLRSLDHGTKELCLSNSSSPRRKSMPSRPPCVSIKDNEVLKRGSVYQTSREVRRMRKLREGSRNAEPALSDEAFLSFEIVDSLPQPLSNEVILLPQQKGSPLASLDTQSKTSSLDTTHLVPTKSMEFVELSFRDLPEERTKLSTSFSGSASLKDNPEDSLMELCLHSSDLEQKGSVEEPHFNKNQMVGTETAVDIMYERGTMNHLPKSFSAKAVVFDSPRQSERGTFKASPKGRFSPLKRFLDPIMKSKSQRNPSLMKMETGGSTAIEPPSIRKQRVFRKSLLNDFSKATQKTEYGDGLVGRDQVSVTASSPAHLHAILKLECKHGAPSYEFAVKDPEDVLSAKTWRTGNAFNWVYTFHRGQKNSSNSNGRGTKDRHGQSPPMVGQMQVSCYLCSEVSETGSLNNSAVTEFILYDIAQARRGFAVEERSLPDSARPPTFTIADSLVTESHLETKSTRETDECRHRVRRPSSDFDSDPSTSYPWAPSDLHPHLEIAAIVVHIPFNKKEMKEMRAEEETSRKEQTSSASATDQGTETISDCINPAHVKVVTPSGPHGLPSTEEGGPSSLLDRWRFGGGCDCGGWDMACPIVVFDNPSVDGPVDYSAAEIQCPMVLFVQGRKEKVPALSIMANGKGQYSVDFHAQLSALQAFSICIAILHSSEAASALGQGKNRQRLYSNSLKLLLEEEVRHLIEAVAEEEKRKTKKAAEHTQPSFFLNPPFSPMGRV